MDNLPAVTCLCPTYGRFSRLREALACFLAQDYPNKQLIIMNDAPIQLNLADGSSPGTEQHWADPWHFQINKRGVLLLNVDVGCANLGQKRQALLELAQTRLVSHWDDDDLYLPWHLSQCVERLTSDSEWAWEDKAIARPACVKPRGAWYMVGQLPSLDVRGIHHNVFEGQIVFDRKKALELGGYTPKHSGQALDLMRAFSRADLFGRFDPYPFVSYVYRWGCGVSHISACRKERGAEDFRAGNVDFGDGAPLTPADLTPYWNAILAAARKEFSKADYDAFEVRLVGARHAVPAPQHAVPGGPAQ